MVDNDRFIIHYLVNGVSNENQYFVTQAPN